MLTSLKERDQEEYDVVFPQTERRHPSTKPAKRRVHKLSAARSGGFPSEVSSGNNSTVRLAPLSPGEVRKAEIS